MVQGVLFVRIRFYIDYLICILNSNKISSLLINKNHLNKSGAKQQFKTAYLRIWRIKISYQKRPFQPKMACNMS